MAKRSLFISHAKKDSELATAISELMINGTPLKADEVIKVSLQETASPAKEDLITVLRSKVGAPDISLVLLTPNYLTSRFCLCELGAVWALSARMIPVLVPPLTPKHVQEMMPEKLLVSLDDSDHLNQLVSLVKEQLGLDDLNLSRWAMEKKKFTNFLKSNLK